MKKYLIILLSLTVIVLSACSAQNGARKENSVEGVIADATMHTIQIVTDDGTQYLFAYEDVEIQTGKNGIVIGGTATVYFDGTLDPSQDVQQVEVKRIVIE